MMKNNYEKDDIIVLTHGVRSDYCFEHLVKVLKDFNTSSLVKEWGEKHADCKSRHIKMKDEKIRYRERVFGKPFYTWLKENHYVEDIEHSEWNTGEDCEICIPDEGGDDDL